MPVAYRHNRQLTLSVDRIAGNAIEIVPSGPMDESTVAKLREQDMGLGTAPPGRVLFNLGEVDSIDSAGLAAILLTRIEVEARGGALAVLAGQPRIARMLERADIRRFVDVATSRSAALEMLKLA